MNIDTAIDTVVNWELDLTKSTKWNYQWSPTNRYEFEATKPTLPLPSPELIEAITLICSPEGAAGWEQETAVDRTDRLGPCLAYLISTQTYKELPAHVRKYIAGQTELVTCTGKYLIARNQCLATPLPTAAWLEDLGYEPLRDVLQNTVSSIEHEHVERSHLSYSSGRPQALALAEKYKQALIQIAQLQVRRGIAQKAGELTLER